MTSELDIETVASGREALCRDILEALPDWFGIPEAIDDYCRGAGQLPMVAARRVGVRVGFASLKSHYDDAVELYVLGVRPQHHRSGAGRELVVAAEQYARGVGARFLTVKTLSAAADSDAYDRTRAFYEAVGFAPLEELPTLWGERNPCLLMIKVL